MEKTQRGPTPTKTEQFQLRDNATGNVRAIRDMLDPELVRFATAVKQDIQLYTANVSGAMNELIQAHRNHAVLEFEMERRRKSIRLAVLDEVPQQNAK